VTDEPREPRRPATLDEELLEAETVDVETYLTDARRIERNLPIRLGGAFDKGKIAATIDTLTQRLRNDGYPYADVLPDYANDKITHVGRVAFNAITGPRSSIGRIDVTALPR